MYARYAREAQFLHLLKSDTRRMRVAREAQLLKYPALDRSKVLTFDHTFI